MVEAAESKVEAKARLDPPQAGEATVDHSQRSQMGDAMVFGE